MAESGVYHTYHYHHSHQNRHNTMFLRALFYVYFYRKCYIIHACILATENTYMISITLSCAVYLQNTRTIVFYSHKKFPLRWLWMDGRNKLFCKRWGRFKQEKGVFCWERKIYIHKGNVKCEIEKRGILTCTCFISSFLPADKKINVVDACKYAVGIRRVLVYVCAHTK